MKKGLVAVMAMVLVVAMAGVAIAEEFTTDRIPMTILGQPAMMVRTVRQGGPLKGFLGNTAQAQSTYGLDKDGRLICLSSSQSNSDGLGKDMLKGGFNNAVLGGFGVWAASSIRPDQINVPVNVKNSNRANNLNVNKGGSAISVSGASAKADADASAAAAASATGGNVNGNQNPGNPND